MLEVDSGRLADVDDEFSDIPRVLANCLSFVTDFRHLFKVTVRTLLSPNIVVKKGIFRKTDRHTFLSLVLQILLSISSYSISIWTASMSF